MVKKINNDNFTNEVLDITGTVLVDFYADWCGPCKMVAPIIEELSQENPEITFGKINVDESPELSVKYNVINIPTLIIFKDGKEKTRIIGYKPREAILEAVLG